MCGNLNWLIVIHCGYPALYLKLMLDLHKNLKSWSLLYISIYLILYYIYICILSIHIKQTVCTYVPISLFHVQTAGPISTNFYIDLHNNTGKVLNTSLTLPGYPKLQNPNRSLEKNLCNTKNALNFAGQCWAPVGTQINNEKILY